MICSNCRADIVVNPTYLQGSTHLVEVKITALTAVGGDGHTWTKHTVVGAKVYCSTRCLGLALRAPILHARPVITNRVAICGARVAGDTQQMFAVDDDKVDCTNCIGIRNMSAS